VINLLIINKMARVSRQREAFYSGKRTKKNYLLNCSRSMEETGLR